MYQACPLAQPFGWETRDTLFSRGWVGFGIMNEIPPRWRVASVGVADPPRTPPFSLHLHRSVETRNNNTESHVGRPRAFFLRGRHGARARGNVFLLFFSSWRAFDRGAPMGAAGRDDRKGGEALIGGWLEGGIVKVNEVLGRGVRSFF